jgi:hypothetical protein
LQQTATLIRQAITQSLDSNYYGVVSKRAPANFLEKCLVVDQLHQLTPSDAKNGHLVSSPGSRAVAILDRTGDISLAAKEVVASRLSFGGKSHYAVDQIFVNEFVADRFIEAVVAELPNFATPARKQGMEKTRATHSQRTEKANVGADKALVESELQKDGLTVVVDNGHTAVASISSR